MSNKEIRDVVAALQRANGRDVVLATVVETIGSTYRRPGARMLVFEDSMSAGSISGGCLEADVVERGRKLKSGEATTVVYDTRAGEDLIWGLGLGCNGVVTVLVERTNATALGCLIRAVEERRSIGMATVYRAAENTGVVAGARVMVVEGDPGWTAPGVEAEVRERLLFEIREAFDRDASRAIAFDGISAFVEVVRPARDLLVFGAGHDSVPLVRMAADLGWDVTLVDPRPAFATHERFPAAREILVARPETAMEHLSPADTTAVVVMTHNYGYDLTLLGWLLASRAFYLGVLGPKRRMEKLLASLAESGEVISEEALARLHAPVGLDVGAETPEEIALSILAEVQAAKSGHRAGFLRDRAAPIHARELIGVVVLAAGESSRFGEPKQLKRFEGKSLLRRAAETAIAAHCGPVTVVLGSRARELRPQLDGLPVIVAENPSWREGMGSSIRAGVAAALSAAPGLDAILVMLCDQPLVTPELLERLVAGHAAGHAGIVACEYAGTVGVPALFGKALIAELATLSGAQGARTLIERQSERVTRIPFPSGAVDVDTREDYARLVSCPVNVA